MDLITIKKYVFKFIFNDDEQVQTSSHLIATFSGYATIFIISLTTNHLNANCVITKWSKLLSYITNLLIYRIFRFSDTKCRVHFFFLCSTHTRSNHIYTYMCRYIRKIMKYMRLCTYFCIKHPPHSKNNIDIFGVMADGRPNKIYNERR